jgi:alcohol dehydrogenase class IV
MQQSVVAFQIPTQILFGVGALERVVEQVRIEDRPKVLIATDQGVKKAGLLDMLTAVLETGGVPFALFDEAEPNPNVEMVEKATNLFRREACSSVVGLGGGSSMDVAKAAAVMATNPGSIRDYEGIGKIGQKPAPIIAIPTTAGTGAEVTPFIVITDVARRYKMTIGGPQAIPSVAIVDPSLMVTMPAKIAASTGLDALTHGIECYTSLLSQPFTEALALHGIHLIGQNLRKGVANRGNLEAMANLAIASTMVATAFGFTRLGNCHAMAHPLGGFYDIPHGVANAILLPHIMEYNAAACPEKMGRVVQALGVDVSGLSPLETAAAAMKAVRQLKADVGVVAGLRELGVQEDEIPSMAADAMKSGNIAVNPRPTNLEDIVALYHAAM